MTVLAAEQPVNNQVYGDDKTNIAITPAQPTFTLKLKSNPTTGYSWFLREYDAGIIAPVKHQYIAPEKPMPGAPGVECWTFKVKPAGFVVPQQTVIRLIYARPWQGNDGATQVVFRVSTQGK